MLFINLPPTRFIFSRAHLHDVHIAKAPNTAASEQPKMTSCC